MATTLEPLAEAPLPIATPFETDDTTEPLPILIAVSVPVPMVVASAGAENTSAPITESLKQFFMMISHKYTPPSGINRICAVKIYKGDFIAAVLCQVLIFSIN